jgi:hypothetical protein
MGKTISISGVTAVTTDEHNKVFNIQFMPDDEYRLIFEQGSLTNGRLQLFLNGSFDYVASKPRVRANSVLIRKAAHGRLSCTRDKAVQLTLKCFASEAIDWQRAFITETVGVMTDLMGPERLRGILMGLIVKL